MNNNYPIGLFDSGIGGISIYNEIRKTLPKESTIYLADNLNAPYGKKTKKEIVKLSIKNTQKLIDLNCKLIVVACNTATTNAVEVLRETFDIPIVGIEPSIKPAILATKTNHIGILATEQTLSSSLFLETSNRFSDGVNIHEQIGYDLVSIIEESGINERLLIDKLRKYTKPMLEENIDNLVLGCTHYYFLKDILEKFLPKNINILDSSRAVSKRVLQILKDKVMESDTLNTKNEFYCNGNYEILERFLSCHNKVTKIDF